MEGKQVGNTARFRQVYSILGAWDIIPTEFVKCGLYATLKAESRDCKYPQKTNCERCPVYNGFMGSERYRLRLQNLESSGEHG